MRNLLKAVLLLPLAIVVILLAVANREPVTLSLDPVSRDAPELSITLPLFAVIFGAVMLGVVIGGIAAWLVQGKHRKAERRYRREAHHLRAEAERQRTGATGTSFAALPPSTSRL